MIYVKCLEMGWFLGLDLLIWNKEEKRNIELKLALSKKEVRN